MDQAELRQLEARCIQEHAPECAAACPLHVDVRAVLAAVSHGDFDTALTALKKRLPFPGIISRVCPQPCQAPCKRNAVGGPIAIAALERACADFGTAKAPKHRPRPRSQRIAIVGGGLSGLTAAYDLAQKGYPVTLFEAGSRLGGQLWNLPETTLPRAVLEKDLKQMAGLGVDIRLNTALGPNLSLSQLAADFEAIYLAVGANAPDTFGLARNGHQQPQVDPLTLATTTDGIFAGGSWLLNGSSTPIMAMSHGRRAAVSIDRYCQRVSLTASRENEGPYQTQLYTDTTGVQPQPVTPIATPAVGYSRDEAITEASRCLLCECMECVKVCAYLDHYGGYPKKFIREIYNNLSIVMGTRQANKLINGCSLCNLCAEVCPTDLSMGAVCRTARQTMVAQNRMPPSAHDFALRDMQFSNSNKFRLARHAPGTATSEFVFFPGCQLAATSPAYIEPVYAWLQTSLAEAGSVGLMLRCCGTPAEWAGRQDLFDTALAEFEAEYDRLGRPKLVLACSSCAQTFQTHLPQVETVSLWELFDQYGLPAAPAETETRGTLAIHDPCTARYDTAMQDSVRRILTRLGYQLEELPLSREKTECCSYGGLMWLANPAVAHKVVERRVVASPRDYVAYCAMCRDFFAGHDKPTWHLLDLILGHDTREQALRPDPGYSHRHENRARVKRNLLKKLWNESMDEQQAAYEAINLTLSAPVEARLEQRLILVEDIQQVIEFAERTGQKLKHPQTGHFLAHYRPVSVTYWVEYAPSGDNEFTVYNAYSHRMVVAEGGKS